MDCNESNKYEPQTGIDDKRSSTEAEEVHLYFHTGNLWHYLIKFHLVDTLNTNWCPYIVHRYMRISFKHQSLIQEDISKWNRSNKDSWSTILFRKSSNESDWDLVASSCSSFLADCDKGIPFKIVPSMNLPSVFVRIEFSSKMWEGWGVLNFSTFLSLSKVVTIWGELDKNNFTLVHAILFESAVVWCISIEFNWEKITKRYDTHLESSFGRAFLNSSKLVSFLVPVASTTIWRPSSENL